MIYDLVIVGNGIAACAALLSLPKGKWCIAVIAPESDAGLSERFKIGETLSPAANEELKLLGVYQDFLDQGHLKAWSSFSSWGMGKLNEKYIWEGRQKAGWYIDRIRFEDFLWQKSREHLSDHFNEKVLSATFKNQFWAIKTKGGHELESRYLLDCSGRSAVVSRNYVSRDRLDKLVAIYAVLHQKSNEVEATIGSLVEPVNNGWFYSALLPDRQLVVSFFTDSDLIPAGLPGDLTAWKKLLVTSDFTMQRIESADFKINSLPKVTDASTIVSASSDANTLLTAGDAAASFDPLSSHGMTTALWSGRKAANAFSGFMEASKIAFDEYKKSFREGIDQYLKERKRIYGLEKRFSGSPFWERRGV